MNNETIISIEFVAKGNIPTHLSYTEEVKCKNNIRTFKECFFAYEYEDLASDRYFIENFHLTINDYANFTFDQIHHAYFEIIEENIALFAITLSIYHTLENIDGLLTIDNLRIEDGCTFKDDEYFIETELYSIEITDVNIF